AAAAGRPRAPNHDVERPARVARAAGGIAASGGRHGGFGHFPPLYYLRQMAGPVRGERPVRRGVGGADVLLTRRGLGADLSSACGSRARAAGAVRVGKTAVPELALHSITWSARWGTTRNPWDQERSPGGSSGGSAAAVASGMVPLATATDGGGSTRSPAAFTG